ncbi:endoplasmic reticulum metallopeptidase 1-like [Tribolium madens]|uniref:endoplasmic reticulum metallopeptidase 1-like n=1 Tax=Tribolium madens TaxID=41895 RepID=UPI001CF71F5D|nr:endoplasmic reticulum metallopeptidase 1-like [Tribolium madens]
MRRRADLIMDNEDETVTLDGSRKITRNSIHSVPVLISFGLIAVLLGLYGLVFTIDSSLPTPLYLADEKSHPEAFITERARHDLKLLTDLGPRVAGGYENEVLAANFLQREINLIMQKAHKNHRIELDVQVVTGSHYIGMKPHGKFVPYSNLQNVVVKVYGKTNASVLINAHFDSVPTSPGGSDDGINCAVMLEILRKITQEPQRPLNNLIFLFNGAEETGLQAAHGFITQHKWAKDCKVVINLEAAGAGGKIILFQTGPQAPWLVNHYKKVPHPYGQAAGEEIFQSNLVPSDTDFRIFRDYGGLVGLDMAFFKHGYRYHTKYDDFEHIPLGSFQHVGDNTLHLVRSLGNAPEVANPKDNPGKSVYFDFLGFTMISYTQTVAIVVNSIVGILSLGIFALSIQTFKLGYNIQTVKYLAMTFGAIIGGWVLAGIFVVLFALFVDKIGYSMSWYANPWLIFGLHAAPTVALSTVLLPFINKKNLTHNVKAQMQVHSVRVIWTVIMILGTIFEIRAMYAFLVPVLFNTLGFMVIYVFRLQHTVRRWQVIYVISLVIPTMFLMYTTLTTLSLFIPVTGRIGPDKNADLLIGLQGLLFTILITSPFVALATLVRNFKYVLYFLTGIFIVSFIIMLTPLGFPYSGNRDSPAPERYWILHTRRIFHDEKGIETKRDSGYFFLNMDRNSPEIVNKYVKDLARARPLTEDCKQHLLCGLPLVHSKMVQIIEFSTWIPAGQPVLPEPTQLEVLSKEKISTDVFRYDIQVTGPDRLGLYFSPKFGVKVLNISLVDKMPSDSAKWNGRDLYFIIHIYGKEAAPLRFNFDVRVPPNITDATTEIAISGIFVHDEKNRKVPHYAQLINSFPDWADVTAWLGSYESWWI